MHVRDFVTDRRYYSFPPNAIVDDPSVLIERGIGYNRVVEKARYAIVGDSMV